MKTKNTLKNLFNLKIGKHLSINIWVLPTLLCAAFGGYLEIFLLSYLFAAIHEAAHIVCALRMGVKISAVQIFPFGICAKLSAGYIRSSEKEFLIAFMGPFASLCMFWLCRLLSAVVCEQPFLYLADMNLALCAINLLPVMPLDGGRMVKSILTSRYGILRAYNLMRKSSKALVLILIIAAALIFFYSFNLSLVLITAFLLQSLCTEQRSLSVITAKELLSSRQKIDSSVLVTKVLSISSKKSAMSILRHLSYDHFLVIYVLDSSGKVINTLTETQVITAMTEFGAAIKFSEIQK